ncbi:PAS domain-containing protein [Streptomyces sp. NPDC008150]|uniref:PAS domain-containing protein n=1 Tax=Streptomyces sp. NPDC008150 TaxID=3364816 RepID=UPI0036E43601
MSSRPSRGAARLAAILDALPDALVLVNANGTVVNANTIALEAFEAPGTALVGRGLLDLLPEFDSKLIPGSMRAPDHVDPQARTKPTRMTARRTDGSEFPVEVTSANLENPQQAYDGYGSGYSPGGDELLMLVVRDLSGTVDTEAELARSQRQTEMILRAASEGVIGTDTDGRIVLVNPAAAQILGYRASDLGGRELHTLILSTRSDGSPFPYAESPLADTLRSGRKHRVRGQVLWSKSGDKVPVDLTTAPVRDGDQLVGAVMTFADRRPYDALAEEKETEAERHEAELERLSEERASELTALRQQHVREIEELTERHEEELAANEERYAALGEREKDRYEALSARHEQLLTLLGRSLRGPLDELRRDLSALAADDAGQLWPEANQVLHHLSAGYSRITTLIDNVLGFQQLDVAGPAGITRTKSMLDAVVAAGVEGAVDLIGPGRVQFAVHAPPIEAEVDPQLLATAIAHLVADVAGVDATGNTPVSTGGYLDNTVVVAAAQRGEVVRIEVRGPYAGGDPVHEPVVRGIVRAHGGVLQTHEVPGMSGSAYVLEVPIGSGAGAVAAPPQMSLEAGPGDTGTGQHGQHGQTQGGRRRARRSSVDAFLDGDAEGDGGDDGGESAAGTAAAPTGRRRRRAAEESAQPAIEAPAASSGTGRRRGRAADGADAALPQGNALPPGNALGRGTGEAAGGGIVTAREQAAGAAASGNNLGGTVPPRGVPEQGGGRQGGNPNGGGERHALPAALPAATGTDAPAQGGPYALGSGSGAAEGTGTGAADSGGQSTGRRRRALAAAQERAAAQEAGPRTVFALPPAEADRPADEDNGVGGGVAGQGAAGPGVAGAGVAGQYPGQQQYQVPAQGQAPGQGQAPVQAQGLARVRTQQPAQAPGAGQQAQAAPRSAPPVPGEVPGAFPAAGVPGAMPAGDDGRHDPAAYGQDDDRTPPQPHPASGPTGRRRRAVAAPADAAGTAVPPQTGQVPRQNPEQGVPQGLPGGPPNPQAAQSGSQIPRVPSVPQASVPPQGVRPPQGPGGPAAPHWPQPAEGTRAGNAQRQTPPTAGQNALRPAAPGAGVPGAAPAAEQGATSGRPLPMESPAAPHGANGTANGGGSATAGPVAPNPAHDPGATQGRAAQPLPAEASMPVDPNSTQGRAISVRTLGQGVPFSRQAAQVQQPTATPPPHQPGGAGRRRKLGTPPDPNARPDQAPAQPSLSGQVPRMVQLPDGAGRSYAIGAPDENADEGPEPLDGPGGAVEVADPPRPQPMDDELPPEPLDNPRRLLVWPAPDVTTQQALSDRGYRPVVVHSREEVDAQIAAFPAALFVDPLTGPITRTALQSLRQAAVAAEVPVLVTAGLGQATREAAYGADPAVLLKALAPRDSEQHPPRVLLVEEHAEIALALTATLERRGMQVARAASDADAVTLAAQLRPNLVVMDLMQVHRRQTGIVDWLRANGQLNRTPLVVYTAAVDQADLPRLASGETVLFLAERSTSGEVQDRIVDLLARIGTN